MGLSCSFTGYRPVKLPFGYDEEDMRFIALKNALKSEILSLCESGYDIFYTGMAVGIDLWCAEIVVEYKAIFPQIKLHAVIPCMGQEKSWSESYKRRYNDILIQADDVLYMNRFYHKGCMQDRNKYLVEHCDMLFAVYDGQKGGTESTIRYGRKLNKPILVLDPVTLAVTNENMQLKFDYT